MGFRIEDYQELRPYLYHTSPAGNAKRILATGRLDPTSALLQCCGRADLVRTRREDDLIVPLEGHTIVIRDQAPLNPVNIAFEGGWELPDLVEYVNSRVFFWPGDAGGPIPYGSTHFGRYAHERPVVLRVRLRSLLAANPGREPQFSRYNTGAARQNHGRPIPRGPTTFTSAARFAGSRADVKEVAFPATVRLPTDTERASGLKGPWRAIEEARL